MTSAYLRWGVRSSLKEYVLSLPGGSIWTDGGAAPLSDGRYEFRAAGYDPTADIYRFSGSVHFRGHGGMLSLDVIDPCVQWSEGGPVLTVADLDDPAERIPFVQLGGLGRDLSAPNAHAAPTTLTAQGAEMFLGNYQRGMLFDPVEIKSR